MAARLRRTTLLRFSIPAHFTLAVSIDLLPVTPIVASGAKAGTVQITPPPMQLAARPPRRGLAFSWVHWYYAVHVTWRRGQAAVAASAGLDPVLRACAAA